MKRLALLLITLHVALLSMQAQRPFEGLYRNAELDINAELNLYDKYIKVPGAEDESCYGFLRGNLNGIWAVMKVVSMDEKKATVRLVNDLGFEAQTVELTVGDKGGLTVKLVKDNNMKAVKERKYVKLPKTFELIPMLLP